MANGDITDVMLGWIVDIFVGIFNFIVKIGWIIIAGLFGAIIGLFKKKDEPSAE